MDVAGLAQAIAELSEIFGNGSAGGVADALRQTSATVDGVHAEGREGIDGLYAAWRGGAGDAAMGMALEVQTAAATLSDQGNAMAQAVDRAAGVIGQGQRELKEIERSFGETVAGLGAEGLSPAGKQVIVSEAIEHLGRAVRVVERVRAELEVETAAMEELATPPPIPEAAGAVPASGVGAEVVSAAVGAQGGGAGQIRPAGGSGDDGTAASYGMTAIPASTGLASAVTGGRGGTAYRGSSGGRGGTSGNGRGGIAGNGRDTDEMRTTATGVKLTLPDGSTVEAPNQQAADAVRNAIAAVGTPYVWGGTTPGAGLDCSGLTQWAYAEAGVFLPRLAQEQGHGHAQIGPGDLMPGDLAVWDGHVAMVIGNGLLVEAGDPVQIGPIRTENIGMQFLGFYRPTA
ncbi:C40 family peptidase [Nocardia huaxiensis]|uniref:C40 family peptidase n=1 Tax=Nocardia huaxiensis TaxID=2755382 RepID=UPI001E5232C7|nr:C40 family peptidase [Nocardia huaxiensis]UFS95593.1 NlpC/P60 family protein [Nocardia huaxiensis]